MSNNVFLFDHTKRTAMGGFPVYVCRYTEAEELKPLGDLLSCIELDPRPSQNIRNHSPDGFNWGYGGSGPAQCALGILLHVTGDERRALNSYELFKEQVIAGISDIGTVDMPERRVHQWLEDNEKFYWRKYTLILGTRGRKDRKFHISYYDNAVDIFADSFASAKRQATRIAKFDGKMMHTGWSKWTDFSKIESNAHSDHILYSTYLETPEHPKSKKFSFMKLSRFVHRDDEMWV